MTDGHHAVVLTGDVTEERILSRTAGEKFDILHFVAHADDQGIDMVSWKMTPKDVAQLAKHTRVQLVFLNVCRSLYLPQYLIDQHVPAVMSHTREEGVSDKEALKLAAYFYEELLRQNGDLHKAYEFSSPRDGTLAWSSNGAYLGALQPLSNEVTRQRRTIRVLAWTIAVDSVIIATEFILLLRLMFGIGV